MKRSNTSLRFVLLVVCSVLAFLAIGDIPSVRADFSWSGVPSYQDPPLIIRRQDTIQVSVTYETSQFCSGTEHYLDIGIQGFDLEGNLIFRRDNEGYRQIVPGSGTVVATFTNLPEGRYNAFDVAATNDPSRPFIRYTLNDYPQCAMAIAPDINVRVISVITPSKLPVGMVSFPYSQSLAAATLAAPLSWSVSNGALPSGLSLNSATGQIVGVPTDSGTFTFTVEVTDATSDSAIIELTALIYPRSSYADFNGCGNSLAFMSSATIGSGDRHFAASGDFNTDGKVDLALTNFTNNGPTLFIYLGNGDGTFGQSTSFFVGEFAQGIAVGDFNSDNKQDLILALQDSNPAHVGLLLGDGNGGFGSLTRFSSGGGARNIAVADFNRDGKQDIAVDGSSNTISVLLGDGNGSFAAATNIFVGSLPHHVAVGDFNADGKKDLAVALRGDNSVGILLGDGNGGFSPVTTLAAGTHPIFTAIADLNGDGKEDLVVANLYSNDLSIFMGNGMGEFTPHSTIPVLSQPISIAVFDFNGNGTLDLAVADLRNDGPISILLGDGQGGFWSTPPRFLNDQTWFVVSADFNSDGHADIASSQVLLNAPLQMCVIDNLAVGARGEPYSQTLGVSGNHPPFAWTITSGALPAGLNLDPLSGLISGTPVSTGTSNFTVRFSAVDLTTATGSVSITVTETPGYTSTGTNVAVQSGTTTFSFEEVSSEGITTVSPIDPSSVGEVPNGFAVSEVAAYQISTTAIFGGSVTIGFVVPEPISETEFNSLSILHNENDSLVDVTTASPPRNFGTRTIYARTTSFSPFYLVLKNPHITALFDQSKAHKLKSTVPIKVQLRSASNSNLSSANTILTARNLIRVGGNTEAPVVDSGNSNPDYNFRYDPTLGGAGGGYIFNLKTQGLAAGTYILSFYAGANHSFFHTVRFELK